MGEPRPQLILCQPVATCREGMVAIGSMARPAECCQQMIWVSPNSREHAAANPDFHLVCLECYPPPPDMAMLPDEREHLRANGYSNRQVDLLVERLGIQETETDAFGRPR